MIKNYTIEPVFSSMENPKVFQLVGHGQNKVTKPLDKLKGINCNLQAVSLLSAIKKIEKVGIGTSFEVKTIKTLKGRLCEITIKGVTTRAFCYNDGANERIIILDVEKETHKGGSTNSKRYMDRNKNKIALVEKLLKESE